MAYEQTKLFELVERSVKHRWSIPEFQRGCVWKPTQVRDLAESLWLDYPIGSLLVWNSGYDAEERIAVDAQRPSQWLVDGQQRTTALCVLFGRKPYWWPSSDEWNKTTKRYDIRFDIDAKEPPFFWVANAAIRRAKGNANAVQGNSRCLLESGQDHSCVGPNEERLEAFDRSLPRVRHPEQRHHANRSRTGHDGEYH